MGRKTGAGVVEQLGQKQSTLFGVGTLRGQHGLIFQHLLLQLQAPLCQPGNTFIGKLELLFQLGDLFLQSRSVLRSCVVHNRILLIILFHFSRGSPSAKNQCFAAK